MRVPGFWMQCVDTATINIQYWVYLLKLKFRQFNKPFRVFHNGLVWFMVFNATFINISVISLRSVLLVEETEISGENH
jgi:hypothetical protein